MSNEIYLTSAMKHIYRKTILLLFACVCSLTVMHAEVLDLTQLLPKVNKKQCYTVSILRKGNLLLKFGRGEGKTNPCNWGYVRFYSGNTLTITADKPMRKVLLHFLKKGKEVTPEVGEIVAPSGEMVSDNAWEGNTKEANFTMFPPKSKTFSLEKIEIEYADEGTPPDTKPDDNPNVDEVKTDIASFKQAEEGHVATLRLNKALVLGCNDAELFVQDHTGLIRLAVKSNNTWQRGDLVVGEVKGKYKQIDALPTIDGIEHISLKKVSSKKATPISVSSDQLSAHPYEWVSTTFTQNKQLRLDAGRENVGCEAYDGAEITCDAIVVPQASTTFLVPISSQDVTICFYDGKQNVYGEAKNVNVCIHHGLEQGVFNSLTLPVSLTDTEVKHVFGQATVVAKFVKEGTESIVFETTTRGMIAGEAYLIKPQAAMTEIMIRQTQVCPPKENPNSQFVGTINAVTPPVGSYYINRKMKLQPFFGNQQIKAFKGYFCNISNADGKSIVVNNVATGVRNVEFVAGEDAHSPVIYNLNGQRVAANKGTLPRGVYLINGKKVVVR